MKKAVIVSILALVMFAEGAGILFLRNNHVRLMGRVAVVRQQRERAVRFQEKTQQMRNPIARAKAGEAEAVRMLHSEVLRARVEVAELEKNARQQRATTVRQAASIAEDLANNRDPEKGFVLLENFRNVGGGTPSTSFQTLIWAAVKGDDNTVASMLALTPPAREEAQAFIDALPADARANYPTPEKLAALIFSGMALNQTAVRVLGQNTLDPLTTSLRISGTDGGPINFTFQLGTNGWQMVMPEGAIIGFQNKLINASAPTPAPRK